MLTPARARRPARHARSWRRRVRDRTPRRDRQRPATPAGQRSSAATAARAAPLQRPFGRSRRTRAASSRCTHTRSRPTASRPDPHRPWVPRPPRPRPAIPAARAQGGPRRPHPRRAGPTRSCGRCHRSPEPSHWEDRAGAAGRHGGAPAIRGRLPGRVRPPAREPLSPPDSARHRGDLERNS